MQYSHIPVLLSEVVSALAIEPQTRVIDCTFGGGGYSLAFVKAGATVLGLDLDTDSILNFQEQRAINPALTKSITLVKGNFDAVYEHARAHSFLPVKGVVFDLGVSSFQLNTAEKGFSFLREGPLDMRLDTSTGISAGRLLDLLDENSLTRIFVDFGDEPHSRRVAKAIVSERERATKKGSHSFWENKSTSEFAGFVEKTIALPRERIHPATRIFQALRMAVNDELGNLERGLRSGWACLESGGKLVVVSFHSGEDRLVKQFIHQMVADNEGKSQMDVVLPSEKEVEANPRSRSAKLRVIEKL